MFPPTDADKANPVLHFAAPRYNPKSPFPPPPPHVSFRLSVDMSDSGTTVCGRRVPAAPPRPLDLAARGIKEMHLKENKLHTSIPDLHIESSCVHAKSKQIVGMKRKEGTEQGAYFIRSTIKQS